jgi:hypothetical protein
MALENTDEKNAIINETYTIQKSRLTELMCIGGKYADLKLLDELGISLYRLSKLPESFLVIIEADIKNDTMAILYYETTADVKCGNYILYMTPKDTVSCYLVAGLFRSMGTRVICEK